MKIPNHLREDLIKRGIFLVTNEVNFGVTHDILSWVANNRPKRKVFTLVIYSSGGSPSSVLEFYALKNAWSKQIRLRGVAIGECGSAALALLQCCDVRYAVAGCSFFVHNMSSKYEYTDGDHDPDKFMAEVKSVKDLHDQLIKIQCQRIGISENEWRELADLGSKIHRPIMTDKALRLGLIDRIIRKYPLL